MDGNMIHLFTGCGMFAGYVAGSVHASTTPSNVAASAIAKYSAIALGAAVVVHGLYRGYRASREPRMCPHSYTTLLEYERCRFLNERRFCTGGMIALALLVGYLSGFMTTRLSQWVKYQQYPNLIAQSLAKK